MACHHISSVTCDNCAHLVNRGHASIPETVWVRKTTHNTDITLDYKCFQCGGAVTMPSWWSARPHLPTCSACGILAFDPPSVETKALAKQVLETAIVCSVLGCQGIIRQGDKQNSNMCEHLQQAAIDALSRSMRFTDL